MQSCPAFLLSYVEHSGAVVSQPYAALRKRSWVPNDHKAARATWQSESGEKMLATMGRRSRWPVGQPSS
eukprot:15290521-Alexandrium_andersonii.AAC.1